MKAPRSYAHAAAVSALGLIAAAPEVDAAAFALTEQPVSALGNAYAAERSARITTW